MHSVPQPMRRIHPNQIQKTRFTSHRIIFLSISFQEWKEQIEYSYFEEEMPDSLPLVEMLLGHFFTPGAETGLSGADPNH